MVRDDGKGGDGGADRRDEKGAVDREQAFRHAVLTVRKAAAGGAGDLRDWARAEVDPDPLEIEDLDGRTLFYDFSVGDVGVVRASANALVGSPVVSLQRGAHTWSPKDAMERAKKTAAATLEGGSGELRLVCYAYPKIGVLVSGQDREGRRVAELIDVADGEPVRDFGAEEPEGSTAYSFLGEAEREAPTRLHAFEASAAELDALSEAAPEAAEGGPLDLKRLIEITAERHWMIARFAWFSSHTVRFAPRCRRPEVFQLYGQQTNVYCAVATGQMILDFYKYHFTQDEIAVAMSTASNGTTNPNQVIGYESLSNDGLDATFDGSPTWAKAKAEIDANRPLKSGIPGHARAVAGWQRENFSLLATPPTRWLQVYDPWPWNANICEGGAVYWEDYAATTHTNQIRVRHA